MYVSLLGVWYTILDIVARLAVVTNVSLYENNVANYLMSIVISVLWNRVWSLYLIAMLLQ